MSQNINTIWKINNLELEMDVSDVEMLEKYENSFDKMADTEKRIIKTGKASDRIRAYCNMYYELFDNLFGQGTGEKIFNGKLNANLCDTVYDDFLNFIQTQGNESNKRRESIPNKYKVNKQQQQPQPYHNNKKHYKNR